MAWIEEEGHYLEAGEGMRTDERELVYTRVTDDGDVVVGIDQEALDAFITERVRVWKIRSSPELQAIVDAWEAQS